MRMSDEEMYRTLTRLFRAISREKILWRRAEKREKKSRFEERRAKKKSRWCVYTF